VLQVVRVTSAPTTHPITLDEAKAHLRVVSSDEDDYIDSLIAAAHDYIASQQRRALCETTYSLTCDYWPVIFELPNPPVVSVSSISYVDLNGATQTLAASQYALDSASIPARVTPAYNVTWPTHRAQANAITMVYTAGYATVDDIPAGTKHAMKILVSHWFENREFVVIGSIVTNVPMSVTALINKERVFT